MAKKKVNADEVVTLAETGTVETDAPIEKKKRRTKKSEAPEAVSKDIETSVEIETSDEDISAEKKKGRTKKAEVPTETARDEDASSKEEINASITVAENPAKPAASNAHKPFVPKVLPRKTVANASPASASAALTNELAAPASPQSPSAPHAAFVPKKLETANRVVFRDIHADSEKNENQKAVVAETNLSDNISGQVQTPDVHPETSQTNTQASTPSAQPFRPKKLEKEHWENSRDARKAAEEEERQTIEKMKAEFGAFSTLEQQNILYYLINERLYWRLIYYMRRYPERLSSQGGYSALGVGNEEFIKIMGHSGEETNANEWLDSHYVPVSNDAHEHVKQFEKQINALLEVESECPISVIKKHFALTNDEFEILSTLVSAMCEESLLRLMTVVWADATLKLPSVTFLCNLLSDEDNNKFNHTLELLSEDGTLRRMRLIYALHSEYFAMKTPLAYMLLTVEQPVINAFCGRGKTLDFSPNMSLHRNALPKRALIADKDTLEELKYVITMPGARLCLVGPRHSGRQTLVTFATVHTKKMSVLELDACREFERIPEDNIETHFSCILRQALLSGCMLLLRFDGIEDQPESLRKLMEHQAQLERIVSFYPGEIVILAQKANPFFDDIFNKPTVIHILPPDVELAVDVWKRALEHKCSREACDHMADLFAHNYTLPVGTIFGVVRDANEALQSTSRKPMELQSHHILEEIRKSFRHQLGSLAEITVSNVQLEGVVLPAEAKAQVKEILEYAKNLHNVLDVWGFRQRSPYGNALSVLFAGPPGTGKTLLACALANELGKVLYRVDISRIVDKYIGETEKNLGRIFDEAAKAQAIILFDEADALFAKRTEVKSSNDRNSNMEINFLLQKLESYNGITILTTNLSKSIDEAFRRRLRFIIDFPMPDVSSRIALWKRMMPPEAPLSDDIRWSWLAHTFEMSGGYIRNAVLKAAISASAANQPISMQHLAKAASDEARSMGKLMRIDENFDKYDDAWDDE